MRFPGRAVSALPGKSSCCLRDVPKTVTGFARDPLRIRHLTTSHMTDRNKGARAHSGTPQRHNSLEGT